jgi:PD-(D/E)XK nuclease superfamily protein
MDQRLDELCARHHVLVATDNAFQRRARLQQALWREEQRLPVGEHRGRPLGSRLAMPSAKDTLSNYLTDPIRAVVRREVLDPERSRGKLFGQPRIFNDLLSSQPLCFNLFGELQQDLALASRALRRLTQGRIERVTEIGFEHSPGRGDPKYTGDRSAFDVFHRVPITDR